MTDPRTADRTLLSHAFVYMVGRSVPAALTLLSVPVFVRLLGTDAYGRYALFAALALLTGTAASSWLSQAVLRFQTDFGLRAPGAYARAVRGGMAASAVAAAAATLAGGLLLPHDPLALALAVGAAITMALFSVSFSARQAALDVREANLSDVARTALAVLVPGALMAAVPALRTPAVMIAGIVAGNAAGLLVAGVPARADGPADGPAEAPAEARALARRMWAFGGPLAGWTLASILLNLSDRYIIEWALGTAAVGAYSAVYDVVFRGVAFAFMPIIMAAHPAIMAEWNRGDRAGARRTVRRTAAGAVALAALVLAFAALAAGPVAAFINPEDAQAGRALVLPVALGAAAWQVAMLAHKPLELAGRTWAMLGAACLSLALNWGLNAALMPRYGLAVAAYATAASGLLYLSLVALLSALLPARD